MAGGLGFLAGLGQAALGLPKGLEVAQTEADKAAALAQQQRQFDASRFADLPTESLPSSYRTQAGMAPTMRIPAAAVPFVTQLGGEERKNELESKRGAIMGNTLRAIGTPEAAALASLVEGGAGNNEKLMGAAEAVMKMKSEADRRTQGNALLGAIMSGDPAKIQAALSGAGGSAVAPTAPVGPAPLGPPRFMPTGGAGASRQLPDFAGAAPQQSADFAASLTASPNPEIRAAAGPVVQAAQGVAETGRQYAQAAGLPPSAPGVTAPAGAPEPPPGFKLPPGMKLHIEPSTGKTTMEFGATPNLSPGDALVKAVYEIQDLERAGQTGTPRYKELERQIQTFSQPVVAPDLSTVYSRYGGQPTFKPEARGPMSETDRLAVGVHNNILAGIQQMKTFTPDEIKNYVGLLQKPSQDVRMTLQGLPGVGGAFGKPDQRYADFKALMGRLQGTAFGEGGKQLTPFEASVVFEYTPTGKEPGGSPAIMAKLKYLEAFTRMARDLRVELAKTGKAELDPNVMDQLLEAGMRKAGLPVPKTPGAEALGSPPPPGSPPAQAPPPGSRQVRVRDAMNPARKGTITLGPGEALPPNLIEDR